MEELPPAYRLLECGHFMALGVDPIACPFCVDYAEAHALDFMASLDEDEPQRVVPHTRD